MHSTSIELINGNFGHGNCGIMHELCNSHVPVSERTKYSYHQSTPQWPRRRPPHKFLQKIPNFNYTVSLING